MLERLRTNKVKLPKPSMTNIPLDTYIIVLILLQRKGTSSRLAILPLYDYGFYLHKEEFCDSLCLRYEWSLTNTSQTCNCAATLTVCHAMVCHMGGLTTQHSKIWDITASLVTEVCHNVTTKPHLQSIRGKRLTIQLANTDNNARTDVCARRFRNTKCTGHITWHTDVSPLCAVSIPLSSQQRAQSMRHIEEERILLMCLWCGVLVVVINH